MSQLGLDPGLVSDSPEQLIAEGTRLRAWADNKHRTDKGYTLQGLLVLLQSSLKFLNGAGEFEVTRKTLPR